MLPSESVTLIPAAATIYSGETLQFAATVNNATNTGVAWSLNPANASTLSSTGLYTAPANIATEQSITITAASLADPAKMASASVTLSPGQGVVAGVSTKIGNVLNLIADALYRRPTSLPW